VLLPETSLTRARVVAERIRKAVAKQPLRAHEAQFSITASIGIAEASVSMSAAGSLLAAADQALYQAKAKGRNCCVAWSPSPPAKMAAE
jgi:diguanylate cyclase (GGDEF)-like protein